MSTALVKQPAHCIHPIEATIRRRGRRTPPSRVAGRRGVTVLEVLISIGVASVGLLGAILLIPLADHQMNQGLVLERANQVGANAFREFDIREMNNPTRWIWHARGSTQVLTLPRDLHWPLDPNPNDAPTNAPLPQFREAFCLDPRFVAANGVTLGPNNEDPTQFPYVVDTNVSIFKMPRITLESFIDTSPPNPLSAIHADSIFVALDDLDFRRPENDRTLAPVQRNNAGGERDDDGDGDIDGDWNPAETSPHASELARKAFGRMSWMATLAPHEKIDANGDEYVLSVVVFHNRDASFLMGATSESDNERVAQIPITGSYNGFISGGVGGGDVALMPRNASLTQAAAELELDVKAGDWVLLSRTNPYTLRRVVDDTANGFAAGSPVLDTNGNPITAQAPRSHRWYRVIAADSGLIDSDTITNAPPDSWIRFVTLEGPDWPTDRYTQVTLVKNVVAVFEKTVRLDTSSLWHN